MSWKDSAFAAALAVILSVSSLPAFSQAVPTPQNPGASRPAAPSLDGGIEWLNTSGPISLRDLRGKVVLLDFWTYCCINCIHVLPDLEYLEEKYGNQLVVIGVHSAKFENEKDSEAIREAIMRYNISHPVINDANMVIWRKFGVQSWPTFVLIDPEGGYWGHASGEGMREVLDENIKQVIALHRIKGTLDTSPIHFDLERFAAKPTPLRYPGKLVVDAASDRIYISDSNHNRIVVATLKGELVDLIGSGRIGRNDGGFAEAEFDHPQGMTLDGQTLYVADTENHLIRKVDLRSKQVETLAGTGKQAGFRSTGGVLRQSSLNSPWDLLIHEGVLYVAMAGPHQIWSHELGSDRIGVFAGTGREDIINGRRNVAAFAQPSGLASDGEALYVVDSEGSAIRRLPFKNQTVTTVVGPSDLPNARSLFEFGDIDGVGGMARLQHPIGIAYHDGTLYVADSYNHKLKKIQLDATGVGTVTTLAGTGKSGSSVSPVEFSEPAGLAVAEGSLFVADTNNHRIVKLDLTTGKAAPFVITGLTPPDLPKDAPSIAEEDKIKAMSVARQTIGASTSVDVRIRTRLPANYKLNPQYPTSVAVSVEGQQAVIAPAALGSRIKATSEGEEITFSLPLTGQRGVTTLEVRANFGYCLEGNGGLCKVRTVAWKVPLTVAETGSDSLELATPPAK